MEKLLDDMLDRLKKNGVRGLVVFIDDDADIYSAATATTKREAIRLLTCLAINESIRQGTSVREVAEKMIRIAATIKE